MSFAEYLPVAGMEKADALEEYMMYGGMPLAVLEPDEKEKRKYLQGLFTNVYIKDIVERYKLKDDNMLGALVDALSSSVGSLTNPNKLANTAGSLMGKQPSYNTVKKLFGLYGRCFSFPKCKTVGCERTEVFRYDSENITPWIWD